MQCVSMYVYVCMLTPVGLFACVFASECVNVWFSSIHLNISGHISASVPGEGDLFEIKERNEEIIAE